MAFDLSTIIGLPVHHPEIGKLIELCEERPQRRDPYQELKDYYLVFPRSGFSLLITGADIVDTIHIHTVGTDDHEPFFDVLPFELTVDTTQDEARDLFGPPTSSGGPIAPMVPSMPVVYWDRWDYEHHTFHLEYPESRAGISLITIGTPSD
jgi:hypothetical protein